MGMCYCYTSSKYDLTSEFGGKYPLPITDVQKTSDGIILNTATYVINLHMSACGVFHKADRTHGEMVRHAKQKLGLLVFEVKLLPFVHLSWQLM